MISSLLMLALLTVTDPAVGPSAAELLDPPSSALYRNLAVFDLQEVSVLESEQLELRLQLGSYANPLDLVNGFSHPIIEVYVGGGDSGSSEILPGSGMVMPDGETWTVALQLTGDYARGWLAGPTGLTEFEPELQIVDDYLYVMTDLPSWPQPTVAAMTGLYSPFHGTGWRPLEAAVNPWAFSSSEQVLPVVDVLALDSESQLAALSGGVLPVTEVNLIENPNTVWFALMAVGIGVAGVGLVLRGMARRPQAAAASDEAAEDEAPDSEEPAEAADGEPVGDEPVVVTAPAAAAAATVVALAAADDVAEAEAPASAEPAEAEAPPSAEPTEDEPDSDEPETPRVGVFADNTASAGQDAERVSQGLDDAEDYALPDFATVDFGEFEEEGPAGEAEEGLRDEVRKGATEE